MFNFIEKSQLEAFTKAVSSQSDQLVALSDKLKPIMHEFADSLRNMPNSIKTLSENGWYIPLFIESSSINHYSKKLQEGDLETVNNSMIDLLDREIDIIERHILSVFPHRKAPLSAALNSHKNGNYYLSLPVFYAQTEGICKELTGFRFFKLKTGEPETKKWVNNFIEGSFTEMLLEPLKHVNQFRQIQDMSKPNGVNRHDVLHGDSFDYGEYPINSYKALSLLFYMAETVNDAKDKLSRK